MNNIQKLIDKIKAEKSKAECDYTFCKVDAPTKYIVKGKLLAFDLHIRKLKLLITGKSN